MEADGESEDDEAEVNGLNEDASLSVEQLMAKYNYSSNAQEDASADEEENISLDTLMKSEFVNQETLEFKNNQQLTSIPPDIALLENLVELSLGNNQLKTLPAELNRLSKLTTLSLFPNPYTDDNQSKWSFIPSLNQPL
ncbi:hypothetical protein G6F68_015858 [Rhizopus microsporus]|nr:hypothetical protein G6F68_015858 [Rhizopus microsporus]